MIPKTTFQFKNKNIYFFFHNRKNVIPDRRMCDKGLPLSGTNGVVYCGKAHDGNNCPEGSTCNAATGVCCQTIGMCSHL